jgi:hypothetical protein
MDNVTKVYGSHTFKVGMQFDRFYAGLIQSLFGKGQFNVSGQYSDIPNQGTGTTGVADLLLSPRSAAYPQYGGVNNVGGLSGFQATNTAPTRDIRYYAAAYFQDDWKVTPTLTFNLGLRWDHFTPYEEIDGRQANFIQSDGGNGPSGTYYIPKKGCGVPRAPSFDALLHASNIALQCTSNNATGNAQSRTSPLDWASQSVLHQPSFCAAVTESRMARWLTSGSAPRWGTTIPSCSPSPTTARIVRVR